MIGIKFKDEVLKLAKQYGSEVAYLTHAAKVLLTRFDEARTLLASHSNLINVIAYEQQIDKQLSKFPKSDHVQPTLSPNVDSMIRGATMASGSTANVTEMHLLIEFICNVIENEGDDLIVLSKACDAPLELRVQLKAMLGGESIESLEKDFHQGSNKRGYSELPAPFIDSLIDDDGILDRVKGAVNKSGGSIVALVGDKRSGKSTIIDSLNYWLHHSQEPKAKRHIIKLDSDEIINTSMHRGVLEQCLSNAIHDCKAEHAILLIDNIHYLNDACRDPEFLPFLSSAADQGVSIICTIMPDTYSMVFDKRGYRASVVRINVNAPEQEARLKIFRNYADKISNQAHIVYDDLALEELNRLAEEHFKTNTLSSCLEVLERCSTMHDRHIVTVQVVQKAVASVKGVALDVLSTSFGSKLKCLNQKMKAELFGQDDAIDQICEQIQLSSLGFKIREKQPRASFMLLGGSGVGKTETTEILARELGISSLLLNMGEYQESHTISKLLGAPPGYIGHDKGDGLLAEFVSKNPNGVILFDEIEKATPKIFDLLLGVLDKGNLTTNTQKELDLSGNLIFFTSNCGAADIGNQGFGFLGKTEAKVGVDRSVFEKTFRPEFRNRLTATIDYKTLSENDLVKITQKSVNKIAAKANNQYGIQVEVSEDALRLIANKYYQIDMGARPIERGVESEIGRRIGNTILESGKPLKVIRFGCKAAEIVCSVH
ncbi:AAA family ATPase [Photobacterium galatheae]|uniref:Clp R domain-containing protein n=1 Tax=Photobacterium galatheae TaxID=1654360 RepID=A0A066RT86_9GAMM|nr:AAA family ATPase [Photobacterium galatheae]KDM90912.1 hypothetical protein EA58_14225 [Photobacterium galatheae]MCM0149124.1 AAA family ATPase [Photobacterium galatheae]